METDTALRLKGRLNLPEVELKPPVQPRTFNRLHQMFERLMPMSTATVAAAASGQARTPSKPTSASRKRKADDANPSTPTPRISNGESVAHWARSYLTDLSLAINAPPGFVGVVMSGLQAVQPNLESVPLPGPALPVSNIKGRAVLEKLAKTIIAIAVLSLPRLGKQIDVRETVRDAVKELIVRHVISMTQFGRVVAESGSLLQEKSSSWEAMDWCKAIKPVEKGETVLDPTSIQEVTEDLPTDRVRIMIPSPAAAARKDQAMPDAFEHDAGADARLSRELPRTMPSAMRQARVDWLSPEKRADYAVWKSDIMERIVEAERQQGIAE